MGNRYSTHTCIFFTDIFADMACENLIVVGVQLCDQGYVAALSIIYNFSENIFSHCSKITVFLLFSL